MIVYDCDIINDKFVTYVDMISDVAKYIYDL